MKITVHKTVLRPWGYETLITATDSSGKIWNECIFSEVEKTNDALSVDAEKLITQKIANKTAADLLDIEDAEKIIAQAFLDIEDAERLIAEKNANEEDK